MLDRSDLDRSESRTTAHDTRVTPGGPNLCTAADSSTVADSSTAAERDAPNPGSAPVVVGRPVQVRASLLGAAVTLATLVGGAVGTRQPVVLFVGVAAVLIGLMIVGVILAAAFTRTMTALAAEGRRRARNVGDVDLLMNGTANAYGQIVTRFTTLVRGITVPRAQERTPDPPVSPVPPGAPGSADGD